MPKGRVFIFIISHPCQDDPSTRHQRASIFAQWLCQKFGDILLRKNDKNEDNDDRGDNDHNTNDYINADNSNNKGNNGNSGGIVLDVAGGRKADVSHELSSR